MKSLNLTLELLGGGTYIENWVKSAVLVDMTDIADLKALQIRFIVWPGIAQGVTKILFTE